MSAYVDFVRSKLGANWVIARRTKNILRRYGGSVVCISPQRYAEIEKEYRAQFGDPYDAVRAELYTALRDFVDSYGHLCPKLKAQGEIALKAERTRR